MNPIMAVRDKLRVDLITMENKTITYRKEQQEQISELTRTNETVPKQLLEIEKTLQTLSQAVTNLQSQKAPTIFSTQDVCYQKPQQEATGGHTQGIYRKAPTMQKTESPVTLNPMPMPTPNSAHNPYINHDRDCQHYPPDRHPPERYTQWSNPYSPPDIYQDNSIYKVINPDQTVYRGRPRESRF